MGFENYFELMVKEAKKYDTEVHNSHGCYTRANSLFVVMKDEGLEAKLRKVIPVEGGMLLPTKVDVHSWSHHFVVENEGLIYDSSYGKPVKKEEYLSKAYLSRAQFDD